MMEFKAAGWLDENGEFKDEMQALICKGVMELLEVFSSHGHSGSSAPYAINMFQTLAKFEPLVSLTGEDWEWNEVGPGVFQNKRCSHVFKRADRFGGQAYDIQAIVFWEWVSYPDIDGGVPYKTHFTSGESAQPITFPYTPKTEYKERVGK
jgi:hypothetical protein